MKKTAAAATLASLAVIGTLATTAAGDEAVIAEAPIPAITASAPATDTPEPVATESPANVPADVEQPIIEQPAPEDLPGEWYEEAVPWVPGAPIDGEIREPYEDEPGFDCRIHGNNSCGVTVHGSPYVITFQNGVPANVYPR